MIGWGCTSSYVHRMAGHKMGESVGKPCATNDVPVQLIIQSKAHGFLLLKEWIDGRKLQVTEYCMNSFHAFLELHQTYESVVSNQVNHGHIMTCRHVQWCLRYDVWMFSRNGNSTCTTKHTKRFHDWWNISVGIPESARVQSLKFCNYLLYRWWGFSMLQSGQAEQ